MKRSVSACLFLLLSSTLAACGSAPGSQEADANAVQDAPGTSPPLAATDNTATATAEQTATEEIIQNIIHLGNLELAPFAPPWFDGDLSTAVFVEGDFLRIDAPIAPYELGKNHVIGAITLASYDSFDIAATFNAEGGVCKGVDYPCGNIGVFNCIVFDFFDFDNMQEFCIHSSALFWHLVTFENGVEVYHSSVQPGDAIHDTGVIYHGEHPIPNEVRVMLQGGVVSGYINGEQVFERDATGVNGKVGVGCVNMDMEEELSNCEINIVLIP